MKVKVEAWEEKFKKFTPRIKKSALKLGRLLNLKEAYLEVFLTGNRFMKKNVWSFPFPQKFPRPDVKGRALGEVYLNPDYIKTDPFFRDARYTIHDKVNYMLVHGLLHLLGYDHKKKNDTIIMQKKEQRLFGQL